MVGDSGKDLFDSFKYTKTRITPLDSEVLNDNRILMGSYNDPRADLFRVLRTNILKQLRENNWTSFFITSALPGAGKSWVATNLAIAIAMEGNQTVLLIDADLRRPSICNHLGLECKFGFIDYLSGVASLEHILVHPQIENLVILPGKESNINYSELISSPRMNSFVEEVKSRYKSRIVIYDIPPIFVADDALLYMEYCDAALFVVEDEVNTTEELQRSLQILEETNLLGLVLNKSKQPLNTHQYGHYYYGPKQQRMR